MYRWRQMTDEQHVRTLQWRRQLKRPPHSVHHFDSGKRHYMITAACYEHVPHVGLSVARMNDFTQRWLAVLTEHADDIAAWVVLPNHYHALVSTSDVIALLKALGVLHGRTSFDWNGEENTRGRQVWCNAVETVIKSPEHFGAARKYVHHNAVKHRYVAKWTEWAWSSAEDYLEEVGRERAKAEFGMYDIGMYDIGTFGEGWDDAEM